MFFKFINSIGHCLITNKILHCATKSINHILIENKSNTPLRIQLLIVITTHKSKFRPTFIFLRLGN